jgi:hypothetical protein
MFTLTLRIGRTNLRRVKTEWDVLEWRRAMGFKDASHMPWEVSKGTSGARQVQLTEAQMRDLDPNNCDTSASIDLAQFRRGELTNDHGLAIAEVSAERAIEMVHNQAMYDLMADVERLTARVAELEAELETLRSAD